MARTTIKNRQIFVGDNLPILRGIGSGTMDLIYLDPPFNSNKKYKAPIGSLADKIAKEKGIDAVAAFRDTWTLSDVSDAWWGELADKHEPLYKTIDAIGAVGGDKAKAYSIYMAVRLIELHRVLKSTGSIYLHCDPTMSHSLKMIMDSIFGQDGFRNEIIWHYNRWTAATRQLQKMHDVIFWYSKGETWTYNMLYKDYSQASLQAHKERGYIQRGQYKSIPNKKGVAADDVWDINFPARAKERTGYPTQKPLALLKKIVNASSNPGDWVLDPFCGCATACIAAEDEEENQNKRNWIGIDISENAFTLLKYRMESELKINPNIPPIRYDIPGDNFVKRSPDIKHTLYGRQKGICNGCLLHFQYQNLEVDHVVAVSRGGGDEDGNLQLLCGHCNRMKGAKDMADLIVSLKKQGIRK